MTEELNPMSIAGLPDELLFEEVASRLKRIYRRQHQLDFLYGCFEFIFHDGRFQGIEERPRFKRYRSPQRMKSESI